jgi:hypothetical protein
MINPLKIFIVSGISILLFSCTKADDSKTAGESDTVKTNQTTPVTETPTVTTNDEKQTTSLIDETADKQQGEIRVNFPEGLNYTTTGASISGFGDQRIFVFDAKEGTTLSATVMPRNGDGNVRIAQIISPSGNADGPFGTDFKYKMSETGLWKIVISENQMAGEPWQGEFILTLKLD